VRMSKVGEDSGSDTGVRLVSLCEKSWGSLHVTLIVSTLRLTDRKPSGKGTRTS